MNSKQFKYVLTLAKEGVFSKAAETLNIKQPSLSQYIKNIEQEIGLELFDRSGRYVRFTDAGKAYIETGRKIFDLENQLENRFSDLASFKTGTITVGISAHRSVSFMPQIVKEYRAKYPGIVLCIEERKRHEIIDDAVNGEFDLFVTTLPLDADKFIYETAFKEENIIAVPHGMHFNSADIEGRKFPVISVSDINGADFVMLNEQHPMQQELQILCTTYGLDLRKAVVCTSLEALVEMVKARIGIAYIPSCLARPDNGIDYYSVKEETSRREIVIAYRRGQYLSQAASDLISTIKDIFSNK